MSGLKIPDLNLFGGKRKSRQTQFNAVQREGVTLLQKTAKKQLLGDIKTQLYLQNYQKGLKHFVCPTKYKQKAEQILKTGNRHEQFLLKAISFPQNTYRCPNCFCKEIEKRRKCIWQVEQKVLPLLRSKSNENKPSFQTLNNKHEIKQIQQITFSSPQHLSRLQQDHRKPLNIEKSVIEIQNPNQITKTQIENIERNTNVDQIKGQLLRQNYKFREDLSQRQAQLNKLDLNLQEDKPQQVELSDLIEAKDSYIAKSRQILFSLDRIIRLGEKRHES